MKWIHTTVLALALAPVFAVSSGCDPKEAPKPVVHVPPAIQPTAERVLLRAQERWNLGMKEDWVAAYEFAAPEFRNATPLSRYLSGMEIYKYENMRVLEVVSVQGDKAYVRTSGIWTPVRSKIPQMQHLKLEPGQTLTQQAMMIESWRFVDGDWHQMRQDHERDFFDAHPELLKKGSEETQPAPPAPK